jgi:hypothetical protein
MNAEEQNRMIELGQRLVTFDFIERYYGMRLETRHNLFQDFKGWCERNGIRKAAEANSVSRSAWESYLQAFTALPMKWAAVQFGMTDELLIEVLSKLPKESPRNHRIWEGLVIGDLKRDFFELLPDMKHKLFRNHHALCQRLHESIANTLQVHVQGRELFCETSEIMGKPIFANDFDSVTLKALSLPHQLWLNFGKPLNLPPDRVSKLFYVQNREELRRYLMTSREPEGLEEYEAHIQGGKT